MELKFRRLFYIVALIVIVLMLIHIEFNLRKNYAPENFLVKIISQNDLPDENAECYAYIISGQINKQGIRLRGLSSVYELIDEQQGFIKDDKGFYLLETGFEDYKGDFEIGIDCLGSDNGTVFKKFNNINIRSCEIDKDSKILIC